ncbi:molybdopterin-binding protein [Paracoccus jiaweipingae]|uniref:molybdopterin-binding protein n=1 Tax=Paracoccus sp. p2-l61 TaxID=3366950 RepID=UPI003793D3BA
MRFDRIIALDWSAAARPGKGANAIWLAVTDRQGTQAENPVSRAGAETRLRALIDAALDAGQRLLIVADFNFAAPRGMAAALTGQADALALWDWLSDRIRDDDTGSNHLHIAAQANAAFAGDGPFWGNGTGQDIDGLPRKRPPLPQGLAELRATELAAQAAGLNPKPLRQLTGAGAVGAQALTGIPVLARLRRDYAGQVAVWPFDDTGNAPVVIAETYHTLVNGDARARVERDGLCRDEAQTRSMAQALFALSQGDALAPLFAPSASDQLLAEEGWTLGVGHEATLRDILTPPPPATPQDTPPQAAQNSAMPAGVDCIPVDEALSRLNAMLHPVTTTEALPPARADGRILAADALARRANPPQPNAAVDGYGYRAADLPSGAAHATLPLAAGRAAAGQPFDGVLPAGHALRILTGAILPEGVDTVAMQEDATLDGNSVTLSPLPKPGANTRPAGEDVEAGLPVLRAGRRLTPADLALATAVGVDALTVFRRLRVGVISTGDELLPDPAQAAYPHQIWDANRPMLLALAARWGCVPVDLGHIRDDRQAIAAGLDRGAESCDVILTSGGASAGDEDHISALLTQHGTLTSWRIAMKPGRPLALSNWGGTPVIGLPGNPVAAFVCALIFARPALSRMGGGGFLRPQVFVLPAGFAKRKKPGRREWLRARMGDDRRVQVFASEGSGRISGISWAEGLVELPDAACDIRPGDPVRYMPFSGFGI